MCVSMCVRAMRVREVAAGEAAVAAQLDVAGGRAGVWCVYRRAPQYTTVYVVDAAKAIYRESTTCTAHASNSVNKKGLSRW